LGVFLHLKKEAQAASKMYTNNKTDEGQSAKKNTISSLSHTTSAEHYRME
jgi:hypothetical protein